MTVEDVVGVFDDGGNQLFVTARAMRALVSERSKPAEHPLEDGTTFGDNVVEQPTEIELQVIPNAGNARDAYQEVKTAYKAKRLVSIQTKMDTYANMLIYEIPHDEDPEMFDTVGIGIRAREFILVNAQYAQLPAKQVKKKSNASTVKVGQKNAKPATPAQTSAAYDLIFGSR